MLQVIPSDNLPVSNSAGSGGTQVFQVGNMLQVVPGSSMSPASLQPVVMQQTKVAVPAPPPTPPQPGSQAHGTAEVSVGHSPITSSPIAKVGTCYMFSMNNGCCLWSRLCCLKCSIYSLHTQWYHDFCPDQWLLKCAAWIWWDLWPFPRGFVDTFL